MARAPHHCRLLHDVDEVLRCLVPQPAAPAVDQDADRTLLQAKRGGGRVDTSDGLLLEVVVPAAELVLPAGLRGVRQERRVRAREPPAVLADRDVLRPRGALLDQRVHPARQEVVEVLHRQHVRRATA